MSDLIERLRKWGEPAASHITIEAAEEIERLQTLLGDCRSDRDRLSKLVEGYRRGEKKAKGWVKKT